MNPALQEGWLLTVQPAMSGADIDSIPGQGLVLQMKNEGHGRGENLPKVTHPVLGSGKETWVLHWSLWFGKGEMVERLGSGVRPV